MSATNGTATTTVPTAASRRVRLLGALQTLARAFMLLIAVLLVAALLLKRTSGPATGWRRISPSCGSTRRP
jgi:hypothetical protein